MIPSRLPSCMYRALGDLDRKQLVSIYERGVGLVENIREENERIDSSMMVRKDTRFPNRASFDELDFHHHSINVTHVNLQLAPHLRRVLEAICSGNAPRNVRSHLLCCACRRLPLVGNIGD